jgi:mono/diheme cytochrome c family protein
MRELVLGITSGALLGFLAMAAPFGLEAQSDAVKFFKTNCTLCHSEDGSGSSSTGKAMKAKDIRSSEVQNKTDAELAEVITKGKGKMPAFGGKIKPGDVTKMVAYIRTLPPKK